MFRGNFQCETHKHMKKKNAKRGKTDMKFFKKLFVFLLIVGVIGGGAYLAITSGVLNQGETGCDHEWSEIRKDEGLVSVADCTHAAVYYKVCAKCKTISDTYTFEYGDPLGHTAVSEATAAQLNKAATCDKAAVYNTYCSACNEMLGTFEYGEPLGHTYGEVAKREFLKSKQTCTDAEIYYLSCTTCGMKHEDDYTFTAKDALGHDWVEEIHKDHIVSGLSCETNEVYRKSCSVCNANHDTETFTANVALGHNFVEQASGAYILTPASCEAAAVYYKSCTNCNKKHESETFVYGNPLGHDYQNVEDKKFLVNPDSTCGDTPEYYVTCTHCEEHNEEETTFIGATLAHVITEVAATEATETEHGTVAHKKCTECGAYFDTEENSITAPEVTHNYVWCENDAHTAHYKACTVNGCTAPHTDEGEHTYDEEGCDTTCNGGCGFERAPQHEDTNSDGVCEKCEGEVHADEVPKGDDEDNFTDWMPL